MNTQTLQASQNENQIGFFDKAWNLAKASAKPVAAAAAVGVACYAGYVAGRQQASSQDHAPSV